MVIVKIKRAQVADDIWTTVLLTFHDVRKITTPTSTNCGVYVCVCVFLIVGFSLNRYRHGAS